MLRGELLLVGGGWERRVAGGETIAIPRGTVHQARNEATSPAVAIW